MHPTIIYIRNSNQVVVAEIRTKLSFTPELNTMIYHNKVKANVMQVIIDVNPAIPAIIINAQIK